MERAIEIVAKTIFEGWGGAWATAPEFRRNQARKEALAALDALRMDGEGSAEAMEFLNIRDMGDHSAA